MVDLQAATPRLAKDSERLAELDGVMGEIPTRHRRVHGDARELVGLEPDSVHLVLTSPPYWTLKEYRQTAGQMGHPKDCDHFRAERDKVWRWRISKTTGLFSHAVLEIFDLR